MNRLAYIIALMLLLIVPIPIDNPGRVGHAWWNFAHVPSFGLLTYLFVGWGTRLPRMKKVQQVAILFLAVPLIEAIQHLTGREASFVDIAYGWVGCIIGLILMHSSSILPRTCAILLFGGAMAYPAAVTFDFMRMHRAFPEIADFGGILERTRWDVSGCDMAYGEHVRLTIRSEVAYPGLFLTDVVADWSSAETLCIEVELMGDPDLEMWVRIDDRAGNPAYMDRFQQAIILKNGHNTVKIPRSDFELTSGGEEMDLSRVRVFGIFFDANGAGRTVILKRIYLELSEF